MSTVLPFTAFNFRVEIEIGGEGGGSSQLCEAAFSECDGLEMSLEVKTIREGGNNGRQIRMVGPVTYGQLTLKRGMTASFDLWDWFDGVAHGRAEDLREEQRAIVSVVVLSSDDRSERVRFVLDRCLPIKLKAPALNAKDGTIAIEEMQIAYESLRLKKPGA